MLWVARLSQASTRLALGLVFAWDHGVFYSWSRHRQPVMVYTVILRFDTVVLLEVRRQHRNRFQFCKMILAAWVRSRRYAQHMQRAAARLFVPQMYCREFAMRKSTRFHVPQPPPDPAFTLSPSTSLFLLQTARFYSQWGSPHTLCSLSTHQSRSEG